MVIDSKDPSKLQLNSGEVTYSNLLGHSIHLLGQKQKCTRRSLGGGRLQAKRQWPTLKSADAKWLTALKPASSKRVMHFATADPTRKGNHTKTQ